MTAVQTGPPLLCSAYCFSPLFFRPSPSVPTRCYCVCPVALALLFAVVKKGDAYLFSPPRRVQWWGSLDEKPLPASSLNRNKPSFRSRCEVMFVL